MGESNKSLPAFYDDNMIGFFPQGPGTIFVYWELSLEMWEDVAQMGGAFIRLYRVFENDNSEYEYHLIREIKPPPFTANWYFDGLDPGTRYCFEMGGKLGDGSFLPLLKSETIVTPPAPRSEMTGRERPAEPGKLRQDPGAGERSLEEVGKNLELYEVMATMPFYMGFPKSTD
jgi:hypothetical protein